MSAQENKRSVTGVLVFGFLALAAAVFLARGAPANGYEVSIYGSTPLGFWVGLAIAFGISVVVSMFAAARHLRSAGLLLGGGAVTALVGLPLLRGYFYYGGADSLTHLGWSREIVAGATSPFELIYPGIHTLGALASQVAGLPLPRALNLVVVAFAVLFVVFATLTVRLLTASTLGMAVGAASAFMLLPVNNVAVELNPHPISQASLLFALVVFLLCRHVLLDDDAERGLLPGVGVALALVAAAVVLYHPQAAAVVILVLAAVSLVQFALGRWGVGVVDSHRTVYAPTAVALAAFAAWIPLHAGLVRQLQVITDTVVGFFLPPVGGQVGGVVAQRGGSLSAIGANLFEVFLKAFFVDAVFVLLTVLLLAANLVRRRNAASSDGRAVLVYLAAGLVALFAFASLHFVADLSRLFFRYAAMMMVVATVVGAIAFYLARDRTLGPVAVPRAAIAVVLVVMLAASTITIFPSPYTYQPSAHRTQMTFDGYETAFDRGGRDIDLVGIRGGAVRYQHAIEGPSAPTRPVETVPPAVLATNLSTHYGADRYLVVTAADRDREVRAYRGLRYSARHFRSLDASPGVSRVYSNGGFDLYLVGGTDAG